MKILRLTLRNLASLAGTHTVDFESDPLRSTGLFSISGPTGSGKSTLLDALCVALYEDTPRLSGANGTKLPDAGNSEITQKDPGNLLRRGAAEGFSEVAFVGVDGQTYTARWSIRRARQRHDGALQPSEMALYQGNVRDGKGALACGGKKSEVLPAIAGKVGLTFEQFTRAVLLAQNDFAVFLKSDDKERAEILQALTGTERFERLSRAVFERNKAEGEALQALRAKSEGQLPLAPEARAAADEELRKTSEAVSQTRQQIAVCETHVAWFVRARELAAGVDAAKADLVRAQAAHGQAEPRRYALAEAEYVARAGRSLYDAERQAAAQHGEADKASLAAQAAVTKAEQSLTEARSRHAAARQKSAAAQKTLAEAAAPLQLARSLDAQLVPAAERLAEKQKERETADTLLAGRRQRASKLATEMQELEGRRTKAQTKRLKYAALAPVLADAAGWIERLKLALKAATETAAREQELVAKRTAESAARRQLETARAEVQQHTKAGTEHEQRRAAAEAACRQFDVEALAAERRALQARAQVLTELQAALTASEELYRRKTETQAAIAVLQETAAKVAGELADVVVRLPVAEAGWKATRENRALVEATVERHTLVLRERLRPEAPCPVCGALDHPYAAHAPGVDAALQGLREAEARHETEVLRLREEKTRLTTQAAANHGQALAKAKEIGNLHAQIETAQGRIDTLIRQAALDRIAVEERRAVVTKAWDDAEQARRALEQREASQRKASKELDALRQVCERAHAAVAQAEKAAAAADTSLTKAVAELQSAGEAHARAAAARADADAALARFFGLLPPGAAERFESEREPFIETFARDTGELRVLDEELADCGKQLEALRLQSDEVRKELFAAEMEAKTRTEEQGKAREAHEKLRAERAAVLGGRAAADVEREVAAGVERTRAEFEAATAQLGEAEKAHAGTVATAAGARTALEQAHRRCGETRGAMDAWLEQYAKDRGRSLERTQFALILDRSATWFDDERQALAALDHAVSKAQGALATCEAAVAQHATTRPTQEEEPAVATALGVLRVAEADAEKQRLAAATAVTADDRCRREHAALLEALAARQKQAEPWAKLNDLIGSADGAKFRTIVQGRTLDLLLTYANAQLELLSSRYRLERLRPSLNLIVIDRDMADERRSVHSLSGGESFLVSLALALGLASLTSNRIRIESLFIDEGFGSLDQATLGTAMNALMHLEAQGRKVGVISHVTEMADAIPVQIRIVKGPGGASRLVVPGAAAPGERRVEASSAQARSVPAIGSAMVEKALAVLERYKTLGTERVSVVSLRRELGCTPEELAAIREALADRVISEGRSVRLK